MVKFLDLQAITMRHGDEIKAAIDRVVESGWFLQGNENKRFEMDYAKYIGTEFCVTVANGLDALKLILRGYKEMGLMQDGDEIIVPANTYIATILAITDNNLVPVLVEPTWDHLEINIDAIEEHITSKTKGVMIVHLYGRIAYNDKLRGICEKYNLKLMEDCAQSHGCAWDGVKTGALGDAAAHSFYPGKNIGALSNGGAVTTNDKALADTIRVIAHYGASEKYINLYKGTNSRLDEIQSAILSVKLKRLDIDNDRRRAIAKSYLKNISNPEIILPIVRDWESNVFYVFPIRCKYRDELQKYLRAQNIETLIHYPIPPHKQGAYKEWNNKSYPITEQIHDEILSLPVSPVMTDEEVEVVMNAVNKFSM